MRSASGYTGFMSEQHYFSSSPEAEFKPRTVQVDLAGRQVSVTTANGIFSPSGIDKGTAVLFAQVPEPHGKYMLDIGCGWGPIALSLAMLAPQSEVYGIDVNSRSLSLTEQNARALGLHNVSVSTPDEIDPTLRFDTIWSNPPIRVGKEVLHNILLTWLPRLAPAARLIWSFKRTWVLIPCKNGWMRSSPNVLDPSFRYLDMPCRRVSVSWRLYVLPKVLKGFRWMLTR